jgi:hypothetical protein
MVVLISSVGEAGVPQDAGTSEICLYINSKEITFINTAMQGHVKGCEEEEEEVQFLSLLIGIICISRAAIRKVINGRGNQLAGLLESPLK